MEYATADRRCIHAGQTCEQHRRAVRRQQQQQHGRQQVEKPKNISVEQARAKAKLLEASLLQ